MMNWEYLDNQMKSYRTKLIDDLRLDSVASNNLASVISLEITNLQKANIGEINKVFMPVPVDLVFEEITAFQKWMELSHISSDPLVTRAQVIVQNYVCFLYLVMHASESYQYLCLKVP